MNHHPEIKFEIETAFIKLEQSKVTPWAFLLTNKMPPIENFHGRIIQYRGVKFEGSPRIVFWNGYIDPFLEKLIGWAFNYSLVYAKERELDPESCVETAKHSLQTGISHVLSRMREIDMRLRSKGSSNKEPPHDISSIEQKFLGKINDYKASIMLACKHKTHMPVAEINKNITTDMKAIRLKSDNLWIDIEKEYGISKRSFGKKINFVKDDFKRKIIFRDIEQAYFLAFNGFCKPAVIISGSVIEELLRLYLQNQNINLSGKTLDYYIKTCAEKGILKTAVHKLADTFREFRNFVHIAKEESSRQSISTPIAKSAVASIFTIAKDLDENRFLPSQLTKSSR